MVGRGEEELNIEVRKENGGDGKRLRRTLPDISAPMARICWREYWMRGAAGAAGDFGEGRRRCKMLLPGGGGVGSGCMCCRLRERMRLRGLANEQQWATWCGKGGA